MTSHSLFEPRFPTVLDAPGDVVPEAPARLQASARRVANRSDSVGDSFEATYPRDPFAELVRLGIALGAFVARQRRNRSGDRTCARIEAAG